MKRLRRFNDHFSRRTFLTKSVVGTAGLLALGQAGAASARKTDKAFSDNPPTGGYDRNAPSNALVTGIDPDELVLFSFDDHWIPLRNQLELYMERPSLYENNPVLGLGKEDEPDHFFAALYGTVFHLNGKFRMWYGAVDNFEDFEPPRKNMRLAYAESDDGIHWLKPQLGLREYRGNKANNLLALEREAYNSPLVLYEPDEPDPSRRFKMTFVGYNHSNLPRSPLLCVAFSPDGFRWKEHPGNPVIRNTWCETSGIYRWNGNYYVNGQTSWPPSNPKRTMMSFVSPDMWNWQQAGIISFYRHNLIHRTGFNVGPQVHLGASVWHRRNVLLGFYGQWEGPANDQKPEVRMNLGLIISNDGLLFREPVPGFSFIKWAEEKSDWKTIRLLQGNAFVNHGDQTLIWYGAASDPTGKNIAVEHRAMVGLATLPRDRFGSLRPRGANAQWISNSLPPMPSGVQLAVNADGLSPQAQLRVEVLDNDFRPVPGYSGDKAARVNRSGLREWITWPAKKKQFSATKPWRLRLQFEGDQAKEIRFYALYVKEKP